MAKTAVYCCRIDVESVHISNLRQEHQSLLIGELMTGCFVQKFVCCSCLGFSDCRDGNWCKKSWELLGCRLCVVFSRRWSKCGSLFLSLVKVEKCIRNKFPSGKTCNNIVIAAWKQGKKIQSWSIKVVENLLNWECTCGIWIWYQIPCTKRDWNWILATNDSIDYKVDQPK